VFLDSGKSEELSFLLVDAVIRDGGKVQLFREWNVMAGKQVMVLGQEIMQSCGSVPESIDRCTCEVGQSKYYSLYASTFYRTTCHGCNYI
jgi:hypothetical protein